MRTLSTLSAVACLAFSLAYSSIAPAQEEQSSRCALDDAAITARVQAALIDNGVTKARQMSRAADVATTLEGVKDVRNNIALAH